MITIRKTPRPLHTMTDDELVDRAARYDNLSYASERWGRHNDATIYSALANHCDAELIRRNH